MQPIVQQATGQIMTNGLITPPSARLAYGGLARVTVELITRALAEEMLRFNKANRHVRKSIVRRYARELAIGTWTLSDQAISFGEDGALINGQHRLLAIVESGVPMLSLVIRGLPVEAKANLDMGERRRLSDVLSWMGESECNVLAGAIRLAWKYDRGEKDLRNASVTPTISEAVSYLTEHPRLREAVAVGRRTAHRTPVLTATPLAVAYYLVSREDPADASNFMARLAEASDLPEGSGLLALRRWSDKQARRAGHHGRPTPLMQLAITIKAMNAWRKGESVSILKWTVGGANPEPFPQVWSAP